MPTPTLMVPHGALPIPKLDCIDFAPPFTPAYLSNGLIALRPQANPLAPAQTLVTGQAQPPQGGASPTAGYPLGANIIAGGAGLLDNPQRVTLIKQSLDMATGELSTNMKFAAAEGITLDIQVLQFLSRSAPCLACQEIRLTASTETEIQVIPLIDSPPAAVGLALAQMGPRTLRVQSGQTCVVHTLAAMVPPAYHSQPQAHAQRLAAWAGAIGFDELSRLNRQAWLDLWQSRIRVMGDAAAQRALDAAFFYVHSSCHASALCGVSPMGLSLAEPYGGRVSDDMDYWLCPAVAPVAPDAAQAMLRYRLASLPAARAAAHLLGLQGALFPLQGAAGGEEACPPQEAAAGDHRAAPRVALAFWEYYLATGDEDFLRRAVWPVLSDFARWIESRGRFTAEGFEIVNADGTRNAAEMNILCRMALAAASRCAAAIGYDPPAAWARLAHAIVIPVNRETGTIIACSGADSQAAPAGHCGGGLSPLVFHDPEQYGAIDADLLHRTLERDEQLRQRQPGEGAAPAAGQMAVGQAVVAAIVGDRAKAAELFQHICHSTWVAPYGLCSGLPGYPQGEHLTTHAAMLMAAMYAFTGLRISEGDWARYPARLPEGWQKIEIGRLWIRGVPMRMTAVNGQRARFTQI